MNKVRVFDPHAWQQVSDGTWETWAPPERAGDTPPFEAQCHYHRDPDGGPGWRWELYRHTGDDHRFARVGAGAAYTLHSAQAIVDAVARRWRDNPKRMARLAAINDRYDTDSVLRCDTCGSQTVMHDLFLHPECQAQPVTGEVCGGSSFDGFDRNEFTEADFWPREQAISGHEAPPS